MTLTRVTSRVPVSHRSLFYPSRGERDPSKMKLPSPESTEAFVLPVWFPSLSSAADPCFVLLGFSAIMKNFFVAARSRTREGEQRNYGLRSFPRLSGDLESG